MDNKTTKLESEDLAKLCWLYVNQVSDLDSLRKRRAEILATLTGFDSKILAGEQYCTEISCALARLLTPEIRSETGETAPAELIANQPEPAEF